MNAILATDCCPSNNIDYVVTYKTPSGEQVHNLCNDCWNKSYPLKVDEITTNSIKIFQTEVSKVVCNRCNVIVTKNMECQTCHPKNNTNEEEDSS